MAPIASVYWVWEVAWRLVEIEHQGCRPLREQVALRFRHPDDDRQIIVWTDRPTCLRAEMMAEACLFDGWSELCVAERAGGLDCPESVAAMPW